MKNIPKRIYLILGDEVDNKDKEIDFKDLQGVTWSSDKIFSSDIPYVRSGIKQPEPSKNELELLKGELEARGFSFGENASDEKVVKIVMTIIDSFLRVVNSVGKTAESLNQCMNECAEKTPDNP